MMQSEPKSRREEFDFRPRGRTRQINPTRGDQVDGRSCGPKAQGQSKPLQLPAPHGERPSHIGDCREAIVILLYK